MKYKEIPVTDIQNIRIGQAENTAAGTGCTVFICENGMRAGLDVRGGGPASRESELLKPPRRRSTSMPSCWRAGAPLVSVLPTG